VDRNLHRYWIRIEPGQARTGEAQFGITAYSETDALEILRYLVFTTADLPQIAEVVADVDVQSLDQGLSSRTCIRRTGGASGTRRGMVAIFTEVAIDRNKSVTVVKPPHQVLGRGTRRRESGLRPQPRAAGGTVFEWTVFNPTFTRPARPSFQFCSWRSPFRPLHTRTS